MHIKTLGRPERLGRVPVIRSGFGLELLAIKTAALRPLLQEKALPISSLPRLIEFQICAGWIDRCHLLKVSFNRAILGSDRGRGLEAGTCKL